MIVTVKMKWLNIFILLLSGMIVSIFLLYAITENIK